MVSTRDQDVVEWAREQSSRSRKLVQYKWPSKPPPRLSRLVKASGKSVSALLTEALSLLDIKYGNAEGELPECRECRVRNTRTEAAREKKEKLEQLREDRLVHGICGDCGKRERMHHGHSPEAREFCQYCFNNSKAYKVAAGLSYRIGDFIDEQITAGIADSKADVVRYALEAFEQTIASLSEKEAEELKEYTHDNGE